MVSAEGRDDLAAPFGNDLAAELMRHGEIGVQERDEGRDRERKIQFGPPRRVDSAREEGLYS